jgi:hypothetical protein
MTLDEFITQYEQDDNVWWTLGSGDHMNLFDDALERIEELTRQRDSARDLAVKSGIFQDHRGTEYLPDPDHPWRADPVGPVAWDRQVEQR